MKILSIDAWRNEGGGWTWDNWHAVGNIDRVEFEKLDSNRKLIKWMRDNGFLSIDSAGKVSTDDDQHNIVICQRSDMMPLFAIEYGQDSLTA